jgi:hypothetical protein
MSLSAIFSLYRSQASSRVRSPWYKAATIIALRRLTHRLVSGGGRLSIVTLQNASAGSPGRYFFIVAASLAVGPAHRLATKNEAEFKDLASETLLIDTGCVGGSKGRSQAPWIFSPRFPAWYFRDLSGTCRPRRHISGRQIVECISHRCCYRDRLKWAPNLGPVD